MESLDKGDKAALLQYNYNAVIGNEWEGVEVPGEGVVYGIIPEGFGSKARFVKVKENGREVQGIERGMNEADQMLTNRYLHFLTH